MEETKDVRGEWKEMSAQELNECASTLVHQLRDLLNGKPVISIAAALFAFIESQTTVRSAIAVVALARAEKEAERMALECPCDECATERKSKRGQA